MTKDSETPPPPPPPPPPEFHPALTVNNIKNAIPLTLDYEKVQYSNWVELFENHACVYNVLDHIDPNTSRPSTVSDALWTRLDAIVKQWIYGTISTDLLETILSYKSTAQQLWDRIREIFQDNKSTRAVYLENLFNSLHLDNFSNVTAYCQQLKSISDQLANVDQPVSDQKMVLRLVAGLNKTDFDTVASMIAQTDPLPSFNTARSRLLLEETRRGTDNSNPTTAFVAQQQGTSDSAQMNQQQQTAGRGGGGGGKGRGGGKTTRGKGRGRGAQGRGGSPASNSRPRNVNSLNKIGSSSRPLLMARIGLLKTPGPIRLIGLKGGLFHRQATQAYNRGPSQQAYTMGPPQQSYGPPMTPTEFGSAYSSMNFTPPDNGWYMDSGATSHMTNNAGSSHREGNNEMQ